VAIKVTVLVDEDRLREAGLGTSGREVMAVLEALQAGRRLTLQSAEHWLPVRDLRVRQKLVGFLGPELGRRMSATGSAVI
jgi:hypothetical protein